MSNLTRFAAKLDAVQKTAPTSLAAEVAELSEAVNRLRDTQRRFQGRFDARMGREGTIIEGELIPSNGLDPDLAAELALQNAPSAQPR